MSMENFSTKGQVNLLGKESIHQDPHLEGAGMGWLGQGWLDPAGQERRAPCGAKVGAEGWDVSVPRTSWTSPCPKNSPGQAGGLRGKRAML